MYYNFKITKTGLKFVNLTKKESTRKGIVSVSRLDIDQLDTSAIVNPEKLQEVL